MFSWFKKSIYRKVLLVIIIIGVVPSILGALWSYLGSREAINRALREDLAAQVQRYSEDADKPIRALASSADRLFSDPVNQNLIQLLELAIIEESEAESESAEDAIQSTVNKLDIRISDMLREQRELASHPAALFHRDRIDALVVMGEGDEAFLERSFQENYAAMQLDLRWNLFDRLDPLTQQPHVFFVYGVDALSLRHSQFLYLAQIKPESIFPFLTQPTEDLSLSLFSDRGYPLYSAGSYELPFKVLQAHNVPASQKLSDGFTLKPYARSSRLIAWHAIPALRQRWLLDTMSGEEQTATTPTETATEKLDANWFIILNKDTSEVISSLGWLYWRISLSAGILIVIILLFGNVMAKNLVGPVVHLTQAAEHIAEGEFDSRAPVQSDDEVGRLARAFNNMAERLQETYRHLNDSLVELRKHTNQLTLLQDIVSNINTQIGFEETLETTVMEIEKLIACDLASISILNPDRKTLTVQMTVPETEETLLKPGAKIPVEGTNRGWVVRHKQPLIKNDMENAGIKGAEDEVLIKQGIRSMISLPLISSGGVIGTFGIGSRQPGAFGETERDILMRMASSLAAAIEHSRLLERTRAFADELEIKVQERTRQLEEAQAKLIQTEKFAATGRLAGTLAHEINNPLGIIKNYLNIVDNQIRSASGGRRRTDPNMENIKIIREELDRIARIVRGLMDFYRPSHGQDVPTDLQETMSRLLTLLEKGWEKRKIKIETHYLDNLPRTAVSPDLMRQVFMNVLRNAEDAMERDGKVTVTFELIQLSDREQENEEGDHHNQAIRITISDTGPGIPEGMLMRIYDPFFTTKKDEKGTGLGLSVTFSILEKYGGSIDVESKEGEGASVILTIPVIEMDDSAVPEDSTKSLLLG